MSEETKAKEVKKKNWFARHKVLTGVGVLLILGLIGSASSNSNTNTTATTAPAPQTAPTPQPAPEPKKPDVPAEYTSALAKATTYASTMHLSKQGLYDQLTSDYGEKFSAPAAQYAIDNVKADWNANALAKAKSYQDTMHMSPAAIHDQLTSDAGEKFTVAEADYAVTHLNE